MTRVCGRCYNSIPDGDMAWKCCPEHAPGPSVVCERCASELHPADVREAPPQTPGDPLRVLAQAILDGRIAIRTEFYENTDGENIAWTEFKVAKGDG